MLLRAQEVAFLAESMDVRGTFAIVALFLFGWATSVFAGTFPAEEAQRSLGPYFPRAQWRFFDKKYETIPSQAFVEDFMPKFGAYLQERGINGVTAGFNEKQYAEVLKIQLEVWMHRQQRKTRQAACGLLMVDLPKRAADPRLPTAWLILNLDGRWAVMHPTAFTIVWLEQFPYADSVASVQF